MGQDIRKMMRDYKPETPKLSEGHEARFESMLNATNTQSEKNLYFWLRIAAVVLVVVAIGSFAYFSITDDGNIEGITKVDNTQTEIAPENVITLGDLSPDLKKIESYYTTGIDVQLASLQVTDDNKELVDGYMQRLSELGTEYQILNKELNEVGPSEATITALVDNLQLRLELLFKLKNKLQ
ncbi:MAG: hypothetical protein HKO97_03295, partial [Flavobacteriaceae bacterium]|nr:hypothetical protein [Flavobacteriaceae bacterium]